jgi:hypothetical protein
MRMLRMASHQSRTMKLACLAATVISRLLAKNHGIWMKLFWFHPQVANYITYLNVVPGDTVAYMYVIYSWVGLNDFYLCPWVGLTWMGVKFKIGKLEKTIPGNEMRYINHEWCDKHLRRAHIKFQSCKTLGLKCNQPDSFISSELVPHAESIDLVVHTTGTKWPFYYLSIHVWKFSFNTCI